MILEIQTTERKGLAVHGWPNSSRVWTALQSALPDLQLHCPDLPGFGQGARLAEYGCIALRDSVLEAAKSVQAGGPWFLIGHSMGGKVAQLVAARQPEGLAALVLVCPVPLIATSVPEEKKAVQRAIYGDRERLATLFSNMAGTPLDAPTLAELTGEALQTDREAFVGWIDTLREEDFRDELPKIVVPTLVLHGEKDPLRTEAQLREQVVEQIAGARLEVLPGVGHLPHLEDPQMLAERVRAFLKETLP